MRHLALACIASTLTVTTLEAASPAEARGKTGMVASRSALASEVGADVLRSGGNAIDAAVATGFALAVTYPSAGNLGGGGFMVIRLADGSVVANDHRERAPGAAHRDMFLDDAGNPVQGLSTHSHLAVGVPGTVAGLLDVHERHGNLSRAEVIEPAIALARGGFLLDDDLVGQFRRHLPRLERYEASRALFTKAGGSPWAAGERFVQADLAATLERVRDEGHDGFYHGKTAELLVAEMERGGGLITLEDMTAYESAWREPIRGTYRGHEIVSMPPPSSGGVLLVHMLNMLEPHDIRGFGYGSAAAMHRMIEAERRAYADRAEHLGDMDFYPTPVGTLIGKPYAARRFADFDPARASLSEEVGAGAIPDESPDTTHVSVMDAAGNAVAYTTTLNLSYGSKIVVPGTGFLLNNEMDDFSIKPNTPNSFGLLGDEANAIAPGKRMLSSMTPTIVLREGEPVLVTGSPGGSTIITTVLQVVMNVIDHGMDLADAVGKPRFHHQWRPDRVMVEPFGFSPDTLAALRAMGHEGIDTIRWGRGIGDANSVMLRDGELLGVSDPRGAGRAVGF